MSDTSPADLKPLVVDAVGASVRRIGRFIQLALIGCRTMREVARHSRLTLRCILGSGRGDLEVTIEVMQTLLRDGQPPKPLSFINTVSNAACYYVAQNLKVLGRSSFVCNRYFAFESRPAARSAGSCKRRGRQRAGRHRRCRRTAARRSSHPAGIGHADSSRRREPLAAAAHAKRRRKRSVSCSPQNTSSIDKRSKRGCRRSR